jgi:hypothetical protein
MTDKVEVIVPSLKITLKGEKAPSILRRGDHFLANRIDDNSLKTLIKEGVLKILVPVKEVKTSKTQKTKEIQKEEEVVVEAPEGVETGEF